ncbi:MAG: hypothetical protein HYX92_18115 [Chloroflexi bacterium]|nr:hypothetical protein [Chloroflexota bacterium]
MVRASVVAERTGVRSVSIVATPFARQGHAIAKALGAENVAIAEYPGVPMVDSKGDLQEKVRQSVVKSIIEGLGAKLKPAVKPDEPGPRDIVFKGSFDETDDYFYKNMWTEGLPVVPPTIDRVEKFLRFTDRSPDEVIGVLLPENREATVWNVAVNGVMAGCRPEYMPVLLAVVDAISEPEFRIEDAGSTPGWEPLIIVNGPIIKELDFNDGPGAMRVGRKANTSIGRFLRLYMRNVPGLRIPPGATDKGTIAFTFNVVLAENEDACREIGWQPFSVDRGFKAGDNVVTVTSVVSISPPTYSVGATPIDHVERIAEIIGRRHMSFWTATCAHNGRSHPLFVLSPAVASVIGKGGWSKDDMRKYLYENVRLPARYLESLMGGITGFNFCEEVQKGVIPGEFCKSKDPNREVPVFLRQEWINILVSGDPGRNQSKGYCQNHKQGPPVSRKVALPRRWKEMRG